MFRGRLPSLCCTGALLALGCGAPKSTGAREVAVHEFAFGAFGGRSVDVRELCGERGLQGFELVRSGSDYLLSLLSVGVYTPHRVRVRCSGSPP